MWAKAFAWRGVIAVAVFAVVTLWLAFEQRLGFYIHPRYNVFTIVMASIGVLFFVIAAWSAAKEHDHEEDSVRRRKGTRWSDIASALLVAGMMVLVVILPPTTLSSATAANRSSNDVGVVSEVEGLDSSGSLELFATLTVRDWAGLLLQNQTPSFYAGKPADVIGIVTPSDASPDVFELTRFVVTCCAVDAQPVSVLVYAPGWQDTWEADSWVRIQGGFAPAPSGLGVSGLVLVPLEITPEEVPREPYLF